MSGRPLDLTQRQVRALCEGAKAAGYAPIVQIGKTWIRLVPEEHAIPPAPTAPVDPPETPTSALERWRAGRNARRA